MAKRLWKKWKQIARRVGDFQARVILTVIYFIIIGPFALIVRWGADPLSLKRDDHGGWRPKAETEGPVMQRATNQF
jgi:hypothetical protein